MTISVLMCLLPGAPVQILTILVLMRQAWKRLTHTAAGA